jgi:hypothetical protein
VPADPRVAGRQLGPDPYLRVERDEPKPLITDLAPDGKLKDTADELSLSGLLGTKPLPGPTGKSDQKSGDDDPGDEPAPPSDEPVG